MALRMAFIDAQGGSCFPVQRWQKGASRTHSSCASIYLCILIIGSSKLPIIGSHSHYTNYY